MTNKEKLLQNRMGDWTGYAGYAERDITPPKGIYFRNWGAANFDVAEGVHRPLMLQCLAMGKEREDLRILITADLGWWKDNNDEWALRNQLLEHFHLREDQLLFCLSHTHAGPSICSRDAHLPGGELIQPYLEFLTRTATDCMEQALSDRSECVLSWSTGVCSLATNRDLEVDGNYLVGYNPGATADQTLLVGQLKSVDGKLKGVLCNYACHPTSFAHLNKLISPDYIGAAREVIQQQLQAPMIFLQGASGDLAPKKQYTRDAAVVDNNGRMLGYAVLSALAGADKPGTKWVFEKMLSSGAPLALWTEIQTKPSVDLQGSICKLPVSLKKLPDVAEIEKDYNACEDRVLRERLWRKLNTRKWIGDRKAAEIPLWVWKIGEAFIVAQPNEAYSLYQTTVRQHFPDRNIIFINIANGYVGYLPPTGYYDRDMYAVWQTPYAQGSLELLIEKTINEIQSFLP